MVLLGVAFIVVGGQMVLNAFRQCKLAEPDVWARASKVGKGS